MAKRKRHSDCLGRDWFRRGVADAGCAIAISWEAGDVAVRVTATDNGGHEHTQRVDLTIESADPPAYLLGLAAFASLRAVLVARQASRT